MQPLGAEQTTATPTPTPNPHLGHAFDWDPVGTRWKGARPNISVTAGVQAPISPVSLMFTHTHSWGRSGGGRRREAGHLLVWISIWGFDLIQHLASKCLDTWVCVCVCVCIRWSYLESVLACHQRDHSHMASVENENSVCVCVRSFFLTGGQFTIESITTLFTRLVYAKHFKLGAIRRWHLVELEINANSCRLLCNAVVRDYLWRNTRLPKGSDFIACHVLISIHQSSFAVGHWCRRLWDLCPIHEWV